MDSDAGQRTKRQLDGTVKPWWLNILVVPALCFAVIFVVDWVHAGLEWLGWWLESRKDLL